MPPTGLGLMRSCGVGIWDFRSMRLSGFDSDGAGGANANTGFHDFRQVRFHSNRLIVAAFATLATRDSVLREPSAIALCSPLPPVLYAALRPRTM